MTWSDGAFTPENPDEVSQDKAQARYEQLAVEMAVACAGTGDPSIYVLRNYLEWKGLPGYVATLRPESRAEEPNLEYLSPNFTVFGYPGNGYLAFCTIGGCLNPAPGVRRSDPDSGGIRMEYILHAPREFGSRAVELLMMVAAYPFLTGLPHFAGRVLPLGEPVAEGSPMDQLYITYPYLDDSEIYTDHPHGQIENGRLLIQTFWVLPIHLQEASFILNSGPDDFEKACHQRHREKYDGWDFQRAPYL